MRFVSATVSVVASVGQSVKDSDDMFLLQKKNRGILMDTNSDRIVFNSSVTPTGQYAEGRCANWQHSSWQTSSGSIGMFQQIFKNEDGSLRGEPQSEYECWQACDQIDGCTHAWFEGNGHWGNECWLGTLKDETVEECPLAYRGHCKRGIFTVQGVEHRHPECYNLCYSKSAFAGVNFNECQGTMPSCTGACSVQNTKRSPSVDFATSGDLEIRVFPTEFTTSALGLSISSQCSGMTDGMSIGSNEEDCTGADKWMWLGSQAGTHLSAGYDADTHWIKQSALVFAPTATCTAYAQTQGQTCSSWCHARGMTCVRGMDDAHHQVGDPVLSGSKCTLFPTGHSRQIQDNAGCEQTWQTQLCACGANHVPIQDISAVDQDPYGESQDLTVQQEITPVQDSQRSHAIISLVPEQSEHYDLVVQAGGDTPFDMQIDIAHCENGNTIQVNNANQCITPLTSGSYTCSEGSNTLHFNYPEADIVVPDGVSMSTAVSPNLAVACKNNWIARETNHKCKYQDAHRLWRLVDQTLQSCYEACASYPDCKYFSFAEAGSFEKVCMGCTGDSTSQATNQGFDYYSVCNRADMNDGCMQHHEHSCSEDVLISSTAVGSVGECRQACVDDDNCQWFAYDGTTCETCSDNQGTFQNRGVSDWKVFDKSCNQGLIEVYYVGGIDHR